LHKKDKRVGVHFVGINVYFLSDSETYHIQTLLSRNKRFCVESCQV